MKFEVVDELQEVVIKGEPFQVRIPSLEETQTFEEKMKSSPSPQESAETTYSFLESLGLPRAAVKKVPAVRLVDMVNFIQGVKKN
jgi:hypothetical protein